MGRKKTLIIGLGNPILGDDGVGWQVIEKIRADFEDQPSIELDCASLGGLSLMERLTGYQCVILIDAIFTGQRPIGEVMTFPLAALPDPTAGHTASAHDTSLRTALNVGRSMEIPLPSDEDIHIVAIEAENVYDFSQELSPPVAAAIPAAVKAVHRLLDLELKGD